MTEKPMFKKFAILSVVLVISSAFALERASSNPVVGGPEHVRLLSVILIKSTLTAVNHGNITGNYTVLRELGSPDFKANYTAADLATSFATLRSQKVDLSPVLLGMPRLTHPPTEDEAGRLHLEGSCELAGQKRVHFHLVYRTLPHGWLIEHIAVGITADSVTLSAAP